MRFLHISDIHLGKLLFQQNLLEIQGLHKAGRFKSIIFLFAEVERLLSMPARCPAF